MEATTIITELKEITGEGNTYSPLASVGLALLVGWRDSVRDSADGVYDTRNDRARFPRHGVH